MCKFRICANIHVFTVLTSNVLLSKRKASVRVPLSTFSPPSPHHPTGASAARQRLTSTTLFSFAIVDIVISPSPSPSSSTSTSPLPLPAHSQYVFIQFAKHFHKIFPQEKHCAHINVYMCVSLCVCVFKLICMRVGHGQESSFGNRKLCEMCSICVNKPEMMADCLLSILQNE